MKIFSSCTLLVLGAIASAQTDVWYAFRFGLNIPAPDIFSYQAPNSYHNFGYNEGKPDARFNNTPATMNASGVLPSTVSHSWNEASNHGWADTFEITDLLPSKTWVRVAANLQNHFPDPVNSSGQYNKERNTMAIVGRIMFRGNTLSGMECHASGLSKSVGNRLMVYHYNRQKWRENVIRDCNGRPRETRLVAPL